MPTRKSNLIAALVAAIGVPAWAGIVTLDFENIPLAHTPAEGPTNSPLKYGSEILGYYNGDPVFHRTGAQSDGITFNGGTLAITAQSAGGAGAFDQAFSGVSVAGQREGGEMSFMLAQGLSLTSLVFHYDSLPSSGAHLLLYSSGTLEVDETLSLCTVPGSDGFCGWTEFKLGSTVLDSRAAKGVLIDRVAWTANPNSFVVDYVQVGTASTEVPEPSSLALAAFGLSLVAFAARRRRG